MSNKFNEHAISPTKARRMEYLFKPIESEQRSELQQLPNKHKLSGTVPSEPTLNLRG